MLVIAIISGIIALVSAVIWIMNEGYEPTSGVLFWVFGTIWLFAFLFSIHWNTGTNNLTGYIYASETRFGYITGHIRFSEQAGQDSQPSFCVKADSEAGKKIKELTGSGDKVLITEPPFFYFANNPFACGTTKMTVEKVKDE